MSRFPVVADLDADGADEPHQRGDVRERRDEPRPRFDLLVEVFLHVVGSQELADDLGEREHGEPVRDVVLHPRRELRLARGVLLDDRREQSFRLLEASGMEHRADVRCDLGLEPRLRDIGLRVLLEVHLAALPRDARKRRLARCPKPVVAVADDELHPVHAALDQPREDPAPVHLVLAQVRVDRQDGPVPVLEDPRHDERRHGDDDPVDAGLVVGRVDEEHLDDADRSVAPLLEFVVHLLHRPGDLVRRDVHVAEPVENRLHLARRHAPDVHLRHRELERPLVPRAALEAPRIERGLRVSDLRDLQRQLPGVRVERLRLVAVGIAAAIVRALVLARPEVELALELHGEVVHPGHHGRESLQAFVHERLHHLNNFCIIHLCRVHSILFLWLLKEYYEPARTTTPRGCRLFLSVIEVLSSSFPKKAIYRKNNTLSAPNRRSQN